MLLESEGLFLDAVINNEVTVAEITARLTGRRTCENCRAIFHLTAKPLLAEGICDHCGGVLTQREDGRPESIAVRLEAYERNTAPLIDFYRRRALLINVAATGSPSSVFERTIAALEVRGKLGGRALLSSLE